MRRAHPTRWIGNVRQWRRTAAVSTTISAAVGFLAITVFTLCVYGLGQAVQMHSVLARATTLAVATEAQTGCWTNASSEVVAQTLQNSGINPALVTVVQYTQNAVAYGNPVRVTLAGTFSMLAPGSQPIQPHELLAARVRHAVVLGRYTLTAQATGSSYYTQGGGSSACATPNLVNPPSTVSTTPAPLITGISPNPLTPNTSATLTGTNFGSSASSGYLTFTDQGSSWGSAQNTQMTVTSWSSTSIAFIVPASAPATGNPPYATVTVTAGSQTSVPLSVSVN